MTFKVPKMTASKWLMAWLINWSIDCLFVCLALLKKLSDTSHDFFPMQSLLLNFSRRQNHWGSLEQHQNFRIVLFHYFLFKDSATFHFSYLIREVWVTLDDWPSTQGSNRSNKQTGALASVIWFVFVVKNHHKHTKYLRREFNQKHCLSHNFFSGDGPVTACIAYFDFSQHNTVSPCVRNQTK